MASRKRTRSARGSGDVGTILTVGSEPFTLDDLIAGGHELGVYFDLRVLQDSRHAGELQALREALELMLAWHSHIGISAGQGGPPTAIPPVKPDQDDDSDAEPDTEDEPDEEPDPEPSARNAATTRSKPVPPSRPSKPARRR